MSLGSYPDLFIVVPSETVDFSAKGHAHPGPSFLASARRKKILHDPAAIRCEQAGQVDRLTRHDDFPLCGLISNRLVNSEPLAKMSEKVNVTFTFRHPGAAPPVFVVGDFSEPAWQPIEMDVSAGEDGDHTFTKSYMVNYGAVVHYKYRIGHGDWWLHDENAPTGKWAGSAAATLSHSLVKDQVD